MTAFSSNEEAVIERELASAPSTSPFDLEIDSTAQFILARNYKCVALQFPDGLLHHASAAVHGLTAALRRLSGADRQDVSIFVLGDTSFDGFQVDFISAQHLAADMIVHYGPVDLEAEGPLPVRLVLGRLPLNPDGIAAAIRATIPSACSSGGGGSGGSGGSDGSGYTASSSSSAGTRAAADASPQRRLLVMPSLPYMHWASSLSGALAAASCDAAMVCSAEVERGAVSSESSARGAISEPHIATPTTVAHAALSNGRLLGRVLPAPLSEEDLAHLDLLYLGTDDQTLSNLVMLLRGATVFVCDPGAKTSSAAPPPASAAAASASAELSIEALSLQTSKRLMRRYYLTQCAREADVVGILIGTLSASQRVPMLVAIKRLIRTTGRKYYVFVMGKLNAAKLANFTEVGVYVLLGSSEHALLDSKDFYRPVVTPYELHLALSPGAEWTGEYILDYARLLDRLPSDELNTADVGGADGKRRKEGQDRSAEEEDEEDEEPVFSVLTGRLLPRRKPAVAEEAAGVGGRGGSGEPSAAGSATTALLATGSGGGGAGGATALVTRQGDYAVARSGAEHLARRAYQGLDPRLGQHAPSTVVEGLEGVASSFAGRAPPRAGSYRPDISRHARRAWHRRQMAHEPPWRQSRIQHIRAATAPWPLLRPMGTAAITAMSRASRRARRSVARRAALRRRFHPVRRPRRGR